MLLRNFLQERKLQEAVTAAGQHGDSPLAKVVGAGMSEYLKGMEALQEEGPEDVGDFDLVDAVNRQLERAKERETANLKRGLTVLATVGSTSVFVGLSSLVNGLGDVAILAMAWITLQLAGGVASLKHWTLAARLCEELRHTLAPELSLAWIAGHGSPDWAALLTVLSTTVIGLAVAIVAVNRKELTYAAG
jgi:biopolymer transport protein ExbB/TolQ